MMVQRESSLANFGPVSYSPDAKKRSGVEIQRFGFWCSRYSDAGFGMAAVHEQKLRTEVRAPIV